MAGTHGALDVERADVLPVLLEKRDQEIDGETDVGGQVIGLHGHVADGDGQAQDLRKKPRNAYVRKRKSHRKDAYMTNGQTDGSNKRAKIL